MSAVTFTSVITLLDAFGFDSVRLDDAVVDVEMVIDNFDVWRSPNSITQVPVSGCVCFRAPEPAMTPA